MALHSDYEFRWKNYRAFKDTGWIKIRPITILIGPNNSGKTSFTSPMLLLDQTLASRDTTTPLVTRGSLIDAGSFKDIVHNHDASKPLFFGLRYHLHSIKGKIGKVGTYPPGGVDLTMIAGPRPENIVLREFAVFDFLNRPFLNQVLRNKAYALDSEAIKLKHPKELKAVRDSKPINFLFSPSVALRRLQSQTSKKGEKVSLVDPSRDFVLYISALSATFGEVNDILRDLAYVGPLRERPRRYYQISGEVPSSVGSRGEHMANLIQRFSHDLRKQLDQWIRRFEFGRALEIQELSDELFSLSFTGTDGASQTNIADAGFGASQVLPLIVQALSAAKNSLTIAEQPEIHLNPRLQYLLADLLVEMAESDHRVIVETHSEHLLLRLRRLVAERKIDHDRVAIYFVERIDGVSNIRPIDLQSDGRITPDMWPKGFFEDSLGESLALAAAQTRASKSKKAL